ncbi:MAG: prepilin-type N-terminal cleavage/methylation domain-containing protein [Candidatus Omnitrophica bacterium]|nr:prepilin-type N-terminal cleavage/methylation domain-containing protein [Candidatus Omnitrophota bacterium]
MSGATESGKLSIRERGMTLLELMIVIIIIAILAGFAVPQYVKIVERNRQGEAFQMLRAIRDAEIRYWHDAVVYTQDFNDLDMESPNNSPNRFFEYTVSNADAITFQLTATRNTYRRSLGIPDYTVQLDQDGNLVRTF